MDKEKKAVWGWALYDWANSAFSTTVMAGFFPIFFKQYWSHGADVNTSTAMLGFANAASSLIVALMAPVLGAVADRAGARKKFLIFFAYMGALMTASLFVVQKGQWMWAVLVYGMGVVGFSGANVFYDALLPAVAREDRIDFVSSLGFAMGYLGGGLLFLINVLMTLWPARFGLADAGAAVRYSFVSVALWWGVFTIFTILWVPKDRDDPDAPGVGRAVKEGLRRFAGTLGNIRRLKTLFLFLAAYWCYIDGVHTIIRMSVDYGMSLGFDSNNLILALLLVQFVGFPAALAFGKLGQRWGVRRAIHLAIAGYAFITLHGVFMTNVKEFYFLAVCIGLFQGGLQALSRSYYARLIPPGRTTEFYGFYNMLGKFAAILGPALMGGVGLGVRWLLTPAAAPPEQLQEVGRLASRVSIGSVLLLFIAGALLFYFVDEEKGGAEARRFAAKAP
ncbi:MAG: MFS transporter [Desulfobacterales bacterium]|nr:MFS transporter [Desulfobacterales bacterium]